MEHITPDRFAGDAALLEEKRILTENVRGMLVGDRVRVSEEQLVLQDGDDVVDCWLVHLRFHGRDILSCHHVDRPRLAALVEIVRVR